MYPDLTNPQYLQRQLQKVGLKPARSSGQNFLICPEVIEATLLTVKNGPKNITELGAGLGTLTMPLLQSGYKVKAIERDPKLFEILERESKKNSPQNLRLIKEDLRQAKWEWAEENCPAYQLVGNIPYNLSGYIIRQLTQLDPPPQQAILLLQKEVGERLVAVPPNMHLITLAVKLWGRADTLLNIPADCFWPSPKVDSRLVLLTPNKEVTPNKEEITNIARTFFQAKRKQMTGVLRNQLKSKNKEEAETILAQANIPSNSRPQELTTDQWQALARML